MRPDKSYADRRRLSFEQAEGVEALPAQMRQKEISPVLASELWEFVYNSIIRSSHRDNLGFNVHNVVEPWVTVLYRHHVVRECAPADEFNTAFRVLIDKVKKIILSGDYIKVFGFLQFALRSNRLQPEFAHSVSRILASCRSAYSVIDNDTIVPIASEAERETLEAALIDLSTSEFYGARAHLKAAAAALTSGDYADSVRESIHAVKSVARCLEPSGKLSNALARLEKSASIHGGLKNGFLAIYGYASDEKGIRHALIDGPSANVDETDALFMIGGCAAFVSYLIGKARSAGLLNKS